MATRSAERIIDLGYQPRQWQRDFSRSLRRWNIAVLHRRAGKTMLAVMQLIDKALRFQRRELGQEGHFDYLAPFREQAKDIAWSILKGKALLIPGMKINESELSVTFPHNSARIRLYGANNDEALRGGYSDFLVVDEAKDVAMTTWTDILLPKLSDRQGGLLMMGTPSGVNLLSETFFRRQTDPDWNVFIKTVYETDALPDDEVAMLRNSMPESSFAREYLCDFSANVENVLLSMSDVQEAAQRHYRVSDYNNHARVLGVDVARYGDDATVLFPRQGRVAFNPVVIRGADAMAVAGRVAQTIARWNPQAVFIDGSGGHGSGVIDRLRDLGHAPIEVQFGGKACDSRYANKRAEMWWLMAEWLKTGGAIPDVAELKVDLITPTYSYANSANKIALESKDAIKARLNGRSPDLADALALTFAYPVFPGISNPRAVADYDPLKEAA